MELRVVVLLHVFGVDYGSVDVVGPRVVELLAGEAQDSVEAAFEYCVPVVEGSVVVDEDSGDHGCGIWDGD